MKLKDEVSWWGIPRKIKLVYSLGCKWEFKWHEEIEIAPGIHLHVYLPPRELIDKWKKYKGINSSMTYLINCKNFCKCYNVPSPSTIKEKINKMKKVIKINLDLKVYNEKKI
jgi:hypothetical protein